MSSYSSPDPLSFCNDNLPNSMRELSRVPLAKRHYRQRPTVPNLSPTASPETKMCHRPETKASPQPETKPLKRSCSTSQQIQVPVDRQADIQHAPHLFKRVAKSQASIEDWIEDTPCAESVQQKVESGEILQTFEGPPIPQILGPSLHATDDIDLPSRESVNLALTTVESSEITDSWGPHYRQTMAMNGVIIDNIGNKIPHDVQQLLTMHIGKERKSPKLGVDEKTAIIQTIEDVWTEYEVFVSKIIATPLFDVTHAEIRQGGNALWSTIPLPRNPDCPDPLKTPKIDLHFGFRADMSNWTVRQLAAAKYSQVAPYSLRTNTQMFPLFLIEMKSEATGGTFFKAEGQLASAGAHRVRSMIWVLDLIDPSRMRSSVDAIVFSAAVSQRETVAYVHYFNPEDNLFYMSWIDTFVYAKRNDMQECHDYVKNVIEWMVDIQKPIIRDALDKLYPITKLRMKGETAIPPVNTAESLVSENGRPAKRQRTE